jgi:hypothetical protein
MRDPLKMKRKKKNVIIYEDYNIFSNARRDLN